MPFDDSNPLGLTLPQRAPDSQPDYDEAPELSRARVDRQIKQIKAEERQRKIQSSYQQHLRSIVLPEHAPTHADWMEQELKGEGIDLEPEEKQGIAAQMKQEAPQVIQERESNPEWQVQNALDRREQERITNRKANPIGYGFQQVGEDVTRRAAPYIRKLPGTIEGIDTAVAQKKIQTGQRLDPWDAEALAKQREQEEATSRRTTLDTVADVGTDLPVTAGEYIGMGGAAGAGRGLAQGAATGALTRLGMPTLANIGGKVAGLGGAAAARTLLSPETAGRAVAAGISPEQSAGGTLRDEFIQNAVFEGLHPFEKQLGDKAWLRIAKGIASGMTANEAAADLQGLAGQDIHRLGPLTALAASEPGPERERAWKNVVAQTVAMGGLEGVLNARSSAAEHVTEAKRQGLSDPAAQEKAWAETSRLVPFNPAVEPEDVVPGSSPLNLNPKAPPTKKIDTAELKRRAAVGGRVAPPEVPPTPAAPTPSAPTAEQKAQSLWEGATGNGRRVFLGGDPNRGVDVPGGEPAKIAKMGWEELTPEQKTKAMATMGFSAPSAEPSPAPPAAPEVSPAPAAPEVPPEPVEPPPPKPGMVRVYHGAAGGDPGNWVSKQREYAEGYANKGGPEGKTYYVDLPEDHPDLQGSGGGNFRIPRGDAENLKPLPRLWKPEASPEPVSQAATPPVGGGKPPEKGFVVANVGQDGKIYYGKPGDLHGDLMQRYPEAGKRGENWKAEGFAGPDGRFLTREEAAAAVGESKPMDAEEYRTTHKPEAIPVSIADLKKEPVGQIDHLAQKLGIYTIGMSREYLEKKIAEKMSQTTSSPEQSSTQQRALPPVGENYTRPLADYSPRFYRETDVANALEFLPNTTMGPGRPREFYLANTPTLALGQHENRGVLMEFDAGGLRGQANMKMPMAPAAWQEGHGEFITKHHAPGDFHPLMRSITVAPDAKANRGNSGQMKTLLERLEGQGWVKETLPDGSTKYTRPETATPAQPAVQKFSTDPPSNAGMTDWEYEKVLQEWEAQQRAKETWRLYHGTPWTFDQFDPAHATPTGLGGKGFFFAINPKHASGYSDAGRAEGRGGTGERHPQVRWVDVPGKRMLDLGSDEAKKFAGPGNIDARIREAGYAGYFNDRTGEHILFDPNEFLKPSPDKPLVPPSAGGKEAAKERMAPEELHRRLREGKDVPGLTKAQQQDLMEVIINSKSLVEAGRARGVTDEAVRQSVEKAEELLHKTVQEPPVATPREEEETYEGTSRLPMRALKQGQGEKVEPRVQKPIQETRDALENRANDLLERYTRANQSGVASDEQLAAMFNHYQAVQEYLGDAGNEDTATMSMKELFAEQQRQLKEIQDVESQYPELGNRQPRRGNKKTVRRDTPEPAVPGAPTPHGDQPPPPPTEGHGGALSKTASALRGAASGRVLGEGLENVPTPGTSSFGAPLTPEERGTVPAGGQADAGEASRPVKKTALANAQVDEERIARKLPPIMSEARRSNPEVWDRAMERLDADPEAAAKLVAELARNPRATTVDENALLLQRKIALSNEHDRVATEYIRAFLSGADATTLNDLETREADLSRQRDQMDRVTRDTGTEWGRAGQFRRQLAAEDYSLSGMLGRAAAAKGEPLTPQEKAQILALQEKIDALQKKLDQAQKESKGTGGFKKFKDALVGSEDAKGEFDEKINQYRQTRRTPFQKLSDLLIKLRVNEVISAPLTLARIIGAAGYQLGITPLREATGAFWSRVPGLAKIAAMAPREGGGLSPTTEAKAFASAFTEGMKDAWRTLRTGKSELDVMHKEGHEPRGWLDLQFSLHDAAKAPAVRAEYTRSFLKRLDQATARGEDVSSPESLLRISAEAYKDGQAAKFRQENWLVDTVNKALTPGPKAGIGEKVAKTTGKLLLPVVRIPTNVVMETGQYLFGTGVGTAQALAAWRRGLENLKPAEADSIMRNFKKGSLGLGLLALGYLQPQMFGGYYQDDEKKKPTDAPVGGAKVGETKIPSAFMHHPLLQVAQFGATVRRVQDKYVAAEKDKDQVAKAMGLGEGVLGGLGGMGEELPLVRTAKDVAKATSAKERGSFLGELFKSLAVPQLFQWLAGKMDVDPKTGEPTKRKPHGVGQHIELGIPGMRQRVPQSVGGR